MLCFFRRLGFWTLDFLKGGKIRKHYKDVKQRMADGRLNKEQLAKLLCHAAETTELYSEFNSSDVNNFPIIDKMTVKNRHEAIFSRKYVGAQVHKMSTSGSTGTPFVMEWNMDKRRRQMADMLYFNERAGQKFGKKYIYFRVWTDRNRKSRLERFMQNLIPVDTHYLDTEKLREIRKRLKSRPAVNACIGYASTYEFLAKYLNSCGDTPDMFRTKVFISSSEVLSMNMKRLVKQTVGCDIVDRYANEENGFLAQTGDCSDEFAVNTASFFVEVLKQDSDEAAEIGEVGRIVVTDLYNFAVPLIRYDTGDLAIKAEEKDGWTTVLKTIQGRRSDIIYDTAGKTMTSHTFGVHMWSFEKLSQYQLIQNGAREYTLKLNGAAGNYTDDEMTGFVKGLLGDDAAVVIEHVDGIPALKSGKFKRTVCNYTYNADDYR